MRISDWSSYVCSSDLCSWARNPGRFRHSVGMDTDEGLPSADDHADLPARIEAAAALNRLGHALVGHRARTEVLERIAVAADELAARLELAAMTERGSEVGASSRFEIGRQSIRERVCQSV